LNLSLKDVCRFLNAETICGEECLDRLVTTVYASDMMSDVLTFPREQSILITGLVNQQVVRTAEMIDLSAIIFVRGKRPDTVAVELARRLGIPLLVTRKTMFESCGLLYGNGFSSVYNEGE